MKGVGAGSQVDSRTNRGNPNQRRIASPLPGQLEHQVPSHGIADQGYALQAETRRIMPHYRAHIAREAGVVERGSQRVGTAAVAHVHPHHVHPGRKSPC